MRIRVNGLPDKRWGPKKIIPELQRVISRTVLASNGCWNWTGYITPKGYGMFRADDKVRSVHRWFYFKVKALGSSDWSDKEIDHLCKNRRCINPNHLELVTRDENFRRGLGPLINKLKTHCPAGHEYSKENTKIRQIGSRQGRRCRECARIYMANKRAYAKNKIN